MPIIVGWMILGTAAFLLIYLSGLLLGREVHDWLTMFQEHWLTALIATLLVGVGVWYTTEKILPHFA